jgi:ParB family transcriptional regulator, chromosome partitioning protein
MATQTKKKGVGIAFDLPQPNQTSEPATSEAGSSGSPSPAPAVTGPATGPVRQPARTGIGFVTASVFEGRKLQQQVTELEDTVEQLKGERGAQPMDPRIIGPGRWANRHEDSFKGPAFEAFKREIADAAGNVQPIKVRPVAAAAREASGAQYELVFGHRRHRACLELGIKVLAIVEEMDDQRLFVQMERENRDRQNLSAWEQGWMYERALRTGLYGSARKLAAGIGRDASDVTKAIRIAKLPEEIVTAFSSPTLIQFQMVSDLEKAIQERPDDIFGAARDLSRSAVKPSPKEVFAKLTSSLRGGGVGSSHEASTFEVVGCGVVTIKADHRGRTTIVLPAGSLPASKWGLLESALRKLLG